MSDITEIIKTTTIEPRGYQLRLIEKAVDLFANKKLRSVLIESCCGSGKSVMGLTIAKVMHEKHGMNIGWVAMRRNLLAQAEAENKAKNINVPLSYISMFDKQVPKGITMLCLDESHHDSTSSMGHIHAAIAPQHILGLSVGGDSMVTVQDPTGFIIHTTIADVVDNYIGTNDDQIKYADGWRVRAFDGQRFCWKRLRSVIRHKPGDKVCYRVHTQKGRSILLTEDHSIYRVIENGTTYIRTNGTRSTNQRPVGVLEEAKGDNLAVGDWLLMEDRLPSVDSPIASIDLTKTLRGQDWRIAGDFNNWVELNIRNENGYKDAHKIRYSRRGGKHGVYLCPNEFACLSTEEKYGIIYQDGKSNWCRSHVPTNLLTYIIGFYLGNGSTDKTRICFTANSKQLPIIISAINRLSAYVEFKIDEQTKPNNCTDVRINNKALADWLRAVTGGKAHQKHIPDTCFNMCNEDVRSVIAGMLATDGHLDIGTRNRRRWYYTTTSKKLAFGLCELLKKLGIVASINIRKATNGGIIRGRQVVGRYDCYTVSFSDYSYSGEATGRQGQQQHFSMAIEGQPVQITKIENEVVEYVYDFSVADNIWQTFVANGFLVHNSATPFRSDRVKLCFDTVLKDAGIPTLIQDGYLSPYHHFTIPKWDVQEVVNTYLREPLRWGKSIIYFHRLEQCAEAADLLRRQGVNVDVVTGASDVDKQIEMFTDGRTSVIVNCMKLTEGFDCPSLKTVFCRDSNRGTTIQMCGRVLRKHPDHPFKQIVQSATTPYPFMKTALAELQYLRMEDTWRTLTVNKNIDAVNQRTIRTLAKIEVGIPKFLQQNTPRSVHRRQNNWRREADPTLEAPG